MYNRIKELLKKKEIDPDKQDVEFEKGDLLAIFIAAMMTLFPVFLAVIAFFGLLTWLFLR